MKNIVKSNITAVILAGGRATRLQGQDKGLMLFKNKPLITYVSNAIHQDVHSIWVSANRNIDLYQEFGEVISDELPDFQGPLAGISAVLKKINTQYLLIVPCDGPYISKILVERLAHEMEKNQATLCVASENNHLHPTFALIDVAVENSLNQYLDSGQRKLGKFFKDNNAIEVDFSDHPALFVNLNSSVDFKTSD